MIYAIEAVGTEYVKFGKAETQLLEMRLSQLQVGCPFDLEVLASADWPDIVEFQIHRMMRQSHLRGEWFLLCPRAKTIIGYMKGNDREALERLDGKIKGWVPKILAHHLQPFARNVSE